MSAEVIAAPPQKYRVLVVDDDASLRNVCSMLLLKSGYAVDCAEDGFSALLSMKHSVPDVLLSDLNMPHMSGFELLSVVRRRFPQVAVIAMSGAYEYTEDVPRGVIADAFYPKGHASEIRLPDIVANLLSTAESRAPSHVSESAPVWIPRNGKDASGRPFIVITCTECLRSFPMSVTEEVNASILVTPCVFCANDVRYIIDFSRSVTSPEQTIAAAAGAGVWPAIRAVKARIRLAEEPDKTTRNHIAECNGD
jgi:CheY-like chemotaxis protein